MRAVAARRLAVAADPVAGDRQHERGQPELRERRGVDEQPAEETADRTEERAAQQRDGDERHEQQVGLAAEHARLREDRDLEDRRDEQEHRGLEAVDAGHRLLRSRRGRRPTSSESKLANGLTCTVRNVAMSLGDADSTVPIGMPYG